MVISVFAVFNGVFSRDIYFRFLTFVGERTRETRGFETIEIVKETKATQSKRKEYSVAGIERGV